MAYRWTGSHAYRDHANDRVIDPGAEIPEDAAERIAAAHPHQVEEIDREAEADGGDEEPEAEEDTADVDTALDQHWQATASAVEAGRYDEVLDDLEEAEDRDSVLEAISDRRDELADE